MVREYEIDLTPFTLFFYRIVKGYKTEQVLLKNYRYPNYGDVIDFYIYVINNKLNLEPDYELAVKFTTKLDFYIQRQVYDLKHNVKSIKMIDYKEDNGIVFGKVLVEYED